MDDGLCFDCGCPAPFIIFMSGEDEKPQEEYACEVHARGHWRCAVIAPTATYQTPLMLDAW